MDTENIRHSVEVTASTLYEAAVLASGIPAAQPDVTEQINGPAVSVAFKNGQPGPAAQAFAKKAADRTLTLDDLRGGTFTITNGGVYGSLMSTPILNPPQVGILGLHKIEQRPVSLGGQISSRAMMYVALSYDHRLVDGREAVEFLVRIKELVEHPEDLLLED